MTRHILVVEDNSALAAGLRYNLELEGFDVAVADDGHAALRLARERRPDLVVLDLMLPGLDGFQVLQQLRRDGERVPVLILSARGEEEDRVRGFRLDADQYMTKPFGLIELLERIHALLRRTEALRAPAAAATTLARPAPIRFGGVVVDPATREVTRDGESVPLTPKAFELLLALVRRDGAVASRVELLREVWGMEADIMTRTVDSHMAELRRKLERDAAEPEYLLTVWKVGYRFLPPSPSHRSPTHHPPARHHGAAADA